MFLEKRAKYFLGIREKRGFVFWGLFKKVNAKYIEIMWGVNPGVEIGD